MVRLLVAASLPFIPILAEAVDGKGADLSYWINYGACGLILGWTLWRAEPRLRGIERAIDRLTRMIAILLSELPHVIEAVKQQCKAMFHELDTAARDRGEKKADES